MNDTNYILMIIDVQEKLVKSLYNNQEMTMNIEKIIKAFDLLNLKIIYTEQNPHKLGKTLREIRVDEDNINLHEKMSFSAGKCNGVIDSLKKEEKSKIIICGLETHICVQQTCIDLIDLNFNIYIVADGVGSRKELDSKIALNRMEKYGAVITTTESVIFECCGTADRAEFKAISQIIKG